MLTRPTAFPLQAWANRQRALIAYGSYPLKHARFQYYGDASKPTPPTTTWKETLLSPPLDASKEELADFRQPRNALGTKNNFKK
jgi:hypothetical protein